MKLFGIFLLVIGSTFMSLSMEPGTSTSPDDRAQLWQQVEQARSKGLPKSAAELLTKIYDSAVQDKAFAEATKALCIRIRVEGQINQPELPYSIRKLEAELPKLPSELKPMAQVIQAHWFLQYYYQNRWQFGERSRTGRSPSDDFETWDLPRLLKKIDTLLQAALSESESLKKIPIDRFDDLLIRGSLSDTYQPTVYDFIAHQAANFYALNEQTVRAQDDFEIASDSPIFAEVNEFLAWKPESTDEKSAELRAIAIYQDLLRFHASDDEPTARLNADLQRIRFGKQIAVGDEVNSRYRAALQRFADKHVKHELSAMALALKAISHQSDQDLVKAHDTAAIGMKRFPDSFGGKRCFNIFHAIETPQLSCVSETIWNGDDTEIQVTHANQKQVYFRMIPFDYRNRPWGNQGNPTYLLNRPEGRKLIDRPAVATWSAELPATPDFKPRTDSLPAKQGLQPGSYMLIASLNQDFDQKNNMLSGTLVWVSDLNVVTRSANQKAVGHVYDARSGNPIAGAKVSVYGWKQDGRNSREVLEGTAITDPRGGYTVNTSIRGQHMVYLQHDDQTLGIQDNIYRRNRTSRTSKQTYFFTDRSIYRPGQTIQFKGICVSSNPGTNNYKTIANREVRVRLLDPNRQQIEERVFRTNEFGSFAGSFTAPRERGTGRMRMQVVGGPNGTAWFRVEEYKRPKFFVKVEKPKQQSRLEQPVSVNVKATSYTGAPIDGSKVTWRVVRNVRYPQWWYWRCWYMPPQNNSQEIADGTGTTSVDGTFAVNFQAEPDRSVDRESQPVFVYTVYADVTDTAGETRSSQQTVNIGYTSLAARMTAKDWLTTQTPVQFKLNTETLDGQGQSASGKLTVYQLQNPDKVQRKKLLPFYRGQNQDISDIKSWSLGDAVATKEITTDDDGTASGSFPLPAGAYKAVFETADAAGEKVMTEHPFQVLDVEATTTPVRTANHFAAKSWSVEPGDQFLAVWGTGYDAGRAFVEIEHRGQVVESFWTDADRTQQPIRFDVQEKHRGGFQLRVTFVKENRAYLQKRRVEVPWTNKDLTIKWEHFVSKLTPGGKETWTAVVSGPDAQKRATEMVAGMYDASLDAFAPHNWPNQIKNLFYRDFSSTSLIYHNRAAYLRGYHRGLSTPSRSFNATYRRLDQTIVNNSSVWSNIWHESGIGFGATYRGVAFGPTGRMMRGSLGGGGGMMMAESAMADNAAPAPMSMAMGRGGGGMTGKSAGQRFQATGDSVIPGKQDTGPGGSGNDNNVNLEQVTARKNLQETAFFYPQLTTDADGIVRIEFTIPEALTKWKFMGFAHDSDLRTAMLIDEITTSKDLMVQPNPPRFLREGDQLEFSVKITNRGDQAQSGKVRLALADATTEEDLNAKFGNGDNEQTFEVPAGQSKSVFWKLSVPDYVGVISWKAVGATQSLSDGEEGLLPVLSKRILVIESLPLPIRGNQTKQFDFAALEKINTSDSLNSQSLTVQMTSNPSWYAVMALPYLMEYPDQCNEQVFNRLYANALGRHIVGSNPKIKRVFDQWRATPALDSPLEKNEDLRNILIAETPWLQDAKKESQARRDVAILFDENRLDNELKRAMRQLAEAQYSDGSWSWFPGGQANDFITLYITTGFGRLRHLGVKVDEQPAIKSLNRLDGWINSTYQRIKRNNRLDQNNLSSTICLYLYGRSFFLKDQDISDTNRPAVDYFLGQAKEHWLQVGKMSQAQLAIATKRFGDQTTPTEILASLTERSQSNEEMGRFWRETKETWWWYRAPIETQAMLIEAYSEVADDKVAVEDCKVWLLKQKQTQNWKTTKATADAVYALLLRGTDSLASSKLVEVSLGGIKIQPKNVEAGTGFYSQTFAGSDVKSAMRTIEVKKVDDGVAWGSVHWKYLEDVSKIEPYEGTPLKLKKSLFLKKNTKAGPAITPIDGPVEVGDEVVTRVEIRVDRDMEYVHLKDQRGSGTEPVNVLSRYKRQDGLWYYESTRDTASHFFIDYLPRGTYVFEYSVRVQHRGQYPSGIATLQCMYAPEFNSHSNSVTIDVE
jgi:uncharacterized protein YfaS (alpha-2-macroglobulin family)